MTRQGLEYPTPPPNAQASSDFRTGLRKYRTAECPPAPAPLVTHLDWLSIAGPQEAVIICFNAKGHEWTRGDVPPIPARCDTLSVLGKKGEKRQVRSMLETPVPVSPKRTTGQGREWTRT